MLTMIDMAELDGLRRRGALRRFADEAAAEFLEVSEVGQVAEVTGAPDGATAQRLSSALRDALFYLDRREDMRKQVRVMTRNGSRVFMERLAPPDERDRAIRERAAAIKAAHRAPTS